MPAATQTSTVAPLLAGSFRCRWSCSHSRLAEYVTDNVAYTHEFGRTKDIKGGGTGIPGIVLEQVISHVQEVS